MYTVVLMAALTATPSTQAWHRGRGCSACHGCHGTNGYVPANNSWYGHGFGYGYGCYGCWGCYGNPSHASSYSSGSFGPNGGWHGGHFSGLLCHGCYGCYGGWSCYGYPAVPQAAGPSGQPSTPYMPDRVPAKKPGKTIEEAPLPKEPSLKKDEQTRARVIVDLPADARLFVDGRRMNGSSSRRVFQTPDLTPGQTYYYELRAEVVRDGQVITANQRVILRPGQAATASFAGLGEQRDAAARANGQ